MPQEAVMKVETLSVHHLRQLESQVREKGVSRVDGRPFLVAEVFSPPRFAVSAQHHWFASRSYDLKTGFDFRLEKELQMN